MKRGKRCQISLFILNYEQHFICCASTLILATISGKMQPKLSRVLPLTLGVQKLGQTFQWLLLVNQMAATACGQTVQGSPGRPVTDGQSERVSADNVCCVQESTFSTLTQKGETGKNLEPLLWHFRRHLNRRNGGRHTWTQACKAGRKKNTTRSRKDKQGHGS